MGSVHGRGTEAAPVPSKPRRPVDAETRRRQLRARAKASGIVVRDGQLVRDEQGDIKAVR